MIGRAGSRGRAGNCVALSQDPPEHLSEHLPELPRFGRKYHNFFTPTEQKTAPSTHPRPTPTPRRTREPLPVEYSTGRPQTAPTKRMNTTPGRDRPPAAHHSGRQNDCIVSGQGHSHAPRRQHSASRMNHSAAQIGSTTTAQRPQQHGTDKTITQPQRTACRAAQ